MHEQEYGLTWRNNRRRAKHSGTGVDPGFILGGRVYEEIGHHRICIVLTVSYI
jgi:hypothetical protein